MLQKLTPNSVILLPQLLECSDYIHMCIIIISGHMVWGPWSQMMLVCVTKSGLPQR